MERSSTGPVNSTLTSRRLPSYELLARGDTTTTDVPVLCRQLNDVLLLTMNKPYWQLITFITALHIEQVFLFMATVERKSRHNVNRSRNILLSLKIMVNE